MKFSMYFSKVKINFEFIKGYYREMLRELSKTRCTCQVFIASSYSPKCYTMWFLIPFVRTKPKRSFQRDRNSSRVGNARRSGPAEFEGDVISYEISGNREGYGLRALADFMQNTKTGCFAVISAEIVDHIRRFVVKIKNRTHIMELFEVNSDWNYFVFSSTI